MKPFPELFRTYTADYESPTSFFKWAAYATIAGVLRDNVWLKYGHREIYPNIYVLALALSGQHRKSVPLDLCNELATQIHNTKIIRGRASIQAVIDDLSGVETNKVTGALIKGGSCLLCADELSSFFVQDPSSTIQILTDIYDARKEWTSRLVSRSKVKITNLCVTMLAASNATLLKDIYSALAINGGLLARTFVVKPDEFRKANSLLEVDITKYDQKELVSCLKEISQLKGELEVVQDAKDEYNKWYPNWRASCEKKADITGVTSRIHAGVLKLAIILSTSSNYDLVIRKCHMEQAISECMALMPNYNDFAPHINSPLSISQAGAIIIQELKPIQEHMMTHADLLARHWNAGLTDELLTKTAITLEKAGMLVMLIDGSKITYQLTVKCCVILDRGMGAA